MTILILASMALGAVVFPCVVAFVCMPQDDGRHL